jgi:hypothetical protein
MLNRQELLKIKSFTDILNNHLHVEVDIMRTRSGYEITTGRRRYDKELSDALHIAWDESTLRRCADTADADVNLFLTLMQSCDFQRPYSLQHSNSRLADSACDAINWIIQHYQQARPFHDKIGSNRARRNSRNTKSITQYISDIFDVYSRVLVVRLDVGYEKDTYDQLDTPEVIKDRELFLAAVRRLYPDLIGYVWALEYGKKRRYHYHMALLFNGSRHQEDVRLARALGELWQQLSHTTSTYYNCNANKDKYDHCYLGMVNHWDRKKRYYMENFICYLCKVDQLIDTLISKRQRCFGRMETPQPRSRAGRPRVYELRPI